jgi:peptidoglycan hydrolase-like protein with peptidoglycan-binding domain
MQKLSHQNRLVLSVAIVTMAVLVLVPSVVLYSMFTKTPENRLSDLSNDVVLDVGESYPGMIDVVDGSLEANGTTLKITINGRDPIVSLGEGEFAYWNVTLILENDDSLRAYNVWVEFNSTRRAGYVQEIRDQNVRTCQVEYNNSLTVFVGFDELPNAKQVEWSVLTVYEKWSGNDLIASASDTAPDDGLQTTVLQP